MSVGRAFDQITDDITDARVDGGIHFRFDQEGGADRGRDVGRYVYKHNLRRATSSGDDNDFDKRHDRADGRE